MLQPPKELTTSRLHLRLPQMEDAETIFEEYAADPEVTRYMTWVPHESSATVAAYLRDLKQQHTNGTEFTWVIEKPGEHHLMGMIAARVRGHKADIGYVLAKKHWNQGFMTEAIIAVSEWLLMQPSIFRVWAVCDTENPGSARALEKSGFEREGMLRRWIVHPNLPKGPRDCFIYGRVK